jgi:hypothetical protein
VTAACAVGAATAVRVRARRKLHSSKHLYLDQGEPPPMSDIFGTSVVSDVLGGLVGTAALTALLLWVLSTAWATRLNRDCLDSPSTLVFEDPSSLHSLPSFPPSMRSTASMRLLRRLWSS